MAARGRGRPAKTSQAQGLLDALAFVEVATNDFEDWQMFVRLSGNMAVASNGQVSAGHPIAEEINLCPQIGKLMAALKRCGKTLVIAEVENQLSIKGDRLRALVPCVAIESLPYVVPDQPDPQAVVTDKLKEAFKVCGSISSEAGESVMEASLLLEANTCTAIGKSRASMLQYWHGINLPPNIVLPKVFAAAIVKMEKPITSMGFGWTPDYSKVISVTIWFEDGAWIKSQCYQDEWPSISPIIDVQSFPVDIPEGLVEAVEAVSNFNEDGTAFFANDKVLSHHTDAVGAEFEVKGLQGGKAFLAKTFLSIAGHIKTLDYTTYPDKVYFFGGEPENPIRGAVMCIAEKVTYREPEPEPEANQGWG